MKDTFDIESRAALVNYRLERSSTSIKEATLMAQAGFYNASINRLYYACYYASVALLLKNDISAQTHSGVKTMLGLHFTAKGKLSVSASKTFTTLFEKGIAEITTILSIVTKRYLMNSTRELRPL